MKNKTLLVTGGSGYLGQHLVVEASKYFIVHSTYYAHPTSIKIGQAHFLDLRNKKAVLSLVTTLKPDVIIHTAAQNPGVSEAEAYTFNQQSATTIAEAAVLVGSRLIHLSTDVVHNGQHSPYPDEYPPDPITPYGLSKAAAEATIMQIIPTALIIRTSLIYGLKKIDRSTAGFIKRLEANQPLTLYTDQIRQPIWVQTLVQAILKLATQHPHHTGTLNLVGDQALNRWDFGLHLLRWWGINHTNLIKPGLAANFPHPVPLDIRLNTTKAKTLLNIPLSGVEEVLQQHKQ